MKLNSRLFLFFTFVCISVLSAQSERKITRNGNSQYETGNFVDAEVSYKKALEKNSNLLEAQFNLGDALAKQERFDEALASFDLVSSTTEDTELKANALHNKGNVLLQQQDLEGALESYKDALRVNPKDHQTRYNYAYAKKKLAEQQEQEENEENQDDENKEEGDENKENQEKGDKKKEDSEHKDQEKSEEDKEQEDEDKQEEGENKEEDSEQEQQDKGQTDGEESEEQEDQQAKPKEDKLTAEEAMRLLEALKQEENKVQDKMKKYKIKGTKQKIEKDW